MGTEHTGRAGALPSRLKPASKNRTKMESAIINGAGVKMLFAIANVNVVIERSRFNDAGKVKICSVLAKLARNARNPCEYL